MIQNNSDSIYPPPINSGKLKVYFKKNATNVLILVVVTVTGRRLDAKLKNIYIYILLFTFMMSHFCFYNMFTRMVFALTYRQFNLEASSC